MTTLLSSLDKLACTLPFGGLPDVICLCRSSRIVDLHSSVDVLASTLFATESSSGMFIAFDVGSSMLVLRALPPWGGNRVCIGGRACAALRRRLSEKHSFEVA